MALFFALSRNTFCNIPPEHTCRMISENAIDVYDLDRAALAEIASTIGAPTMEELGTPIDAVPEGASLHAFRSGHSAWS